MFAGLGFGLAVGLVRIVQGAHFLSDVAAAGLVVVAVNVLLARFLLLPQNPRP
jgi:lipid A 4'-phosphatase